MGGIVPPVHPNGIIAYRESIETERNAPYANFQIVLRFPRRKAFPFVFGWFILTKSPGKCYNTENRGILNLLGDGEVDEAVKRKDLWIIGGVVAAALLAWAVLFFTRPAGDALYVTIYVQDKLYARVLATDYQTFTIDQGDGKINVVVLDETGVFMESSTCKNQICVHKGTLKAERAEDLPLDCWIVCLPNGVSVSLSAGEAVDG